MTTPTTRVRPRRALFPAAACLLALGAGCTGHYRLSPRLSNDDGLAWVSPTRQADLQSLDRWRQGVGPAYLSSPPAAVLRPPARRLIVVSWNTAVGSGDVMALLGDLRGRERGDMPVVLLLQEVYRKGPDVPEALDRRASFASGLGVSMAPSTRHGDILSLAAASGLHAYYAPSMRNGSPEESDEDRGNAILSSLPLADLTAIELPFERQRRVAVAATLSGTSATSGAPWTLRVVSAHLDNVAGARRLWVAGSSYARARQARALVTYLGGSQPTILAGDFNTWFGFADAAYRETARAFGAPPPDDRRATFRGLLRLDHVFFRLPEGWRARYERGHSRFGSDHYPLVATIDLD